MDKTFLDVLVEYPAIAMQKIGGNQKVVEFLTNIKDIDMSGDEAAEVYAKNLFDFGFVPQTVDEASAYICVETNMIKAPTPTMQNMRMYVTVVCHNNFMGIDTSVFKGIIGNRRDNLARCVDKVLNGSEVFGIGQLKLESAMVVAAPAGFSARELTYSISDFKKKVGAGR